MVLNWVDLSIQMFTSSMARSKFFTYSPYIFRKGASFCKMSPIRGFKSLWEQRGREWEELLRRSRRRGRGDGGSPLLHAFLQRRQQELLVETVDWADVGEDPQNDITGEGGARPSLLQESGTENLWEEMASVGLIFLTTGKSSHPPSLQWEYCGVSMATVTAQWRESRLTDKLILPGGDDLRATDS